MLTICERNCHSRSTILLYGLCLFASDWEKVSWRISVAFVTRLRQYCWIVMSILPAVESVTACVGSIELSADQVFASHCHILV